MRESWIFEKKNREKYHATDPKIERGREMEVLVTGGSGMVGRNLTEALESRGIAVVSPGRKKLDLTKKEEVDDYFRNNPPDAVVHCAGLVGGIQANIARPYDFAMQNISMGSNIHRDPSIARPSVREDFPMKFVLKSIQNSYFLSTK